jgi:hypothetical protein
VQFSKFESGRVGESGELWLVLSSEVGNHADSLQLKMNEHIPIFTSDTAVQVVGLGM